MKTHAGTLSTALAIAAVVFLGTPAHAGDEIELDEAEVFIEFNSTDGDFGIQLFWDGEPWKWMRVRRPDGRTVMKVRIRANLAEQGMTEGFFESAEPSKDELSMEEFLERFPEGEYAFEGRTLERETIGGETDFTHVLPAPPEGLWPGDDAEIDATLPLVAGFDAVTETLDGEELEIELYEMVIETDDESEPQRIFSMIIDGSEPNPSATIPPEFLQPGGDYKLEVIAQEESGNRTISETEWSTSD